MHEYTYVYIYIKRIVQRHFCHFSPLSVTEIQKKIFLPLLILTRFLQERTQESIVPLATFRAHGTFTETLVTLCSSCRSISCPPLLIEILGSWRSVENYPKSSKPDFLSLESQLRARPDFGFGLMSRSLAFKKTLSIFVGATSLWHFYVPEAKIKKPRKKKINMRKNLDVTKVMPIHTA